MKKIFAFITIIVILSMLLAVPVFATSESETELVEAESVYETETGDSSETEPCLESDTYITTEAATETETETEGALAVFWNNVQENMTNDPQFWVLLIFAVILILALVFVIMVLMTSVNPTARKSMRGMSKGVEIVHDIQGAVSQSLGDLNDEAKRLYAENEERLVKIAELKEQIAELIQNASAEKRNLFLALAYDMRIHKIVCDRLAMPITDKAVIDMWYATGIDYIKNGLNEEDVAKLESFLAMLDKVGADE